MAKQEAFLINQYLGDWLDSVKAQIKKYEDLEKTLAAQEVKIRALNEFATYLNGKVQRHQNFKQELNANKTRLDEVFETGED